MILGQQFKYVYDTVFHKVTGLYNGCQHSWTIPVMLLTHTNTGQQGPIHMATANRLFYISIELKVLLRQNFCATYLSIRQLSWKASISLSLFFFFRKCKNTNYCLKGKPSASKRDNNKWKSGRRLVNMYWFPSSGFSSEVERKKNVVFFL